MMMNNISSSYRNRMMVGNNNSLANTTYNLLTMKSYAKYVRPFQYATNNSNVLLPTARNLVTVGKSEAKSLSDTLKDLSATGNKSAFQKKKGVSSNKDIVAINSSKTVAVSNNNKNTSKVVSNQLATTQKNTGASLTSTDKDYGTGNKSFKITTPKDGKTYNFNFAVGAGDNNRDVQNKMASAINSRNIGVTAKVNYDSATKKSSLVIESTTTGKEAGNVDKFQISDVIGNAVSQSAVGTITQQADNAVYTENGISKTSKTNDVTLNNGAHITLKKASAEEVSVSVATDSSDVIDKVKDMASSYNKLIEALDFNSFDPKTNSLNRNITGMTSSYSPTLKRAGINVNLDGKLSIDETKLNTAAENGSLQRIFERANYGFGGRLSNYANQLANNPTRYIGKTSYAPSYQSNGMGMFSPFSQNKPFYGGYSSNIGLLFDGII